MPGSFYVPLIVTKSSVIANTKEHTHHILRHLNKPLYIWSIYHCSSEWLSTKTFTFCKFIYRCLFGGRLRFSPSWGPLSFSPSQFVQFSCAHCGDSRGSECPWATLWLSSSCTKIVFWGLSEFQPKLSLLLSPPPTYLYL